MYFMCPNRGDQNLNIPEEQREAGWPGDGDGGQARSGRGRHGRSSPPREGEGKKVAAAGVLGFAEAPRP